MKENRNHPVYSQIKHLYSMKTIKNFEVKSSKIRLHRNDDGSYDIPDNVIFSSMLIFVDDKPIIEKMIYIEDDNCVIIPNTTPESKVYTVIPI